MKDETLVDIAKSNDIPPEDKAPIGESDDKGNRQQPGGANNTVSKKSYVIQKKIKNLSSVTHDSNESTKRRKRRSQISKLSNKMGKKKRWSDSGEPSFDYSNSYDPGSEEKNVEGILQIMDNGPAFLRNELTSFHPSPSDVIVPKDLVQKWGLRTGLSIKALTRAKHNKIQSIATQILEIQNAEPVDWRDFAYFHSLTSLNPYEYYRLSSASDIDRSMHLLELLAPIGRGQRALIVAPPRTGKTMLLEKIANGIAANHPEAEIILLLIDERPEEVTHLTRRVNAKVYASCLDHPIHEHISLSRMVIEIAQRKAERGKDVVILLDSITRMSRAFNNDLKSSGRTLSGGVDAKALTEPKKFFGAARKLEEGGSLTIIATALIQTGSQMDEVIFQEFKGTGNMELVLSRKLAEKRIYPAIDINMSGTRREELILPERYFKAAIKFRRYLSSLSETNQMQAAIQAIEKHKTTEEFVRAFV